ncbi:MAG: hypothetical protein COA86_12420 [Kangiella sp.]|nr:MAG: hypothetical protein COA86_12420 [Kangiella sp.]
MFKAFMILLTFCFMGLSSNLMAMGKLESLNKDEKAVAHPNINFDELANTLGIDPAQKEMLQAMMTKHMKKHDQKRVEKQQKHKLKKAEHIAIMKQQKQELATILSDEQLAILHKYMTAHKPKGRKRHHR